MRTNLADYFRRLTGQSIRAIAQETGIEPSTFNRQMTGSTSVTVETVVAVCRAYDLDLADAFVAAGFITDSEANGLGAQVGLSHFSDLELAEEIVRRLAKTSASGPLTGALPLPVTDSLPGADPPSVPTTTDELVVLTPSQERALRQADLRLAAKRGRHPHDIPHAE